MGSSPERSDNTSAGRRPIGAVVVGRLDEDGHVRLDSSLMSRAKLNKQQSPTAVITERGEGNSSQGHLR